MSLSNTNNLVDLINKTRLTEYDKLVKDTYLTSLDIIGNDIQYTYGNKQTKTLTLPVFKGATSDTNGTAGLVPAPPTEDSQNKYLRGDGTWVDITTTSDLGNWGQARDGITDVNNLPLGFSAVIEGTHEHSPDSFWSTVLTMGASDNEIYRQQISFPWGSTGDLKIKYRVENNGTWTDWMSTADGGNAATVNGYTVASNVPANAVFTDTTYDLSPYLLTSNLSTTLSGMAITAKSFTSTNADGFRLVQGNYGVFLRNDGKDTYLLLTASGDQYGSWNNLRPLSITNSSGATRIGNGLTVSNGFAASVSGGSALGLTNSGTSVTGWLNANAGHSDTARSDYTTYQWRNVAASTSATPTTNATYGTSGAIYLQYT